MHISSFYNLYLLRLNYFFDKCKWGISIHVNNQINNGGALAGWKGCKCEISHTTTCGTFTQI